MEDMEATGKGELVKLVKKECRAFSSIIVRVLQSRLRTTWQHIQTLELIDPFEPELDQYDTPAVWNVLRDLCGRRGIDFHTCKEQIIELRAGASVLDEDSKTMIIMDLV